MGDLLFVKIHDTVSGGTVFMGTVTKDPSIEGVCADAGYRKTFENYVTTLSKTVTISKKIKPNKWAVLSKRWIVERTLP